MPAHAQDRPRGYRSARRPQPCDQCRGRKLKCNANGQPPCGRCQRDHRVCTFVEKPQSRRQKISATSAQVAISSPAPHDTSLAQGNLSVTPTDQIYDELRPQQQIGASDVPVTPTQVRTPIDLQYSARLETQLTQSLEGVNGYTAVFLGASSVLDPWLLRHCKFDELGLTSLGLSQLRNAGGVPTAEKIPAHFLMVNNDTIEFAANETQASDTRALRQRLDHLIVPADGRRLIRLFHQHVFPMLPIISRSELGLIHLDSLPTESVLAAMPTCLLAGIYAITLPFHLEDDELANKYASDKTPETKLWRIVYESLQYDLHRPKLSVLQAALLFAHRSPLHHVEDQDMAFSWSFVGSVVGLAHSLGLHLECRMCAIPAQEKRVRRRLWWATFIMDKFISLLNGKPSYIHSGDFDVSGLDDIDFAPTVTSSKESKHAFRDLAQLALVADCVQSSLYSLRACQSLAEDPFALLQASKPLFDSLNAWRANSAAPEPFLPEQHSDSGNYPMTVYFAYLILGLYIWRALLRSTAHSLPAPHVIESDERPFNTTVPQEGSMLLEPFSFDLDELPNIDLPDLDTLLGDNSSPSDVLSKELYQAALAWANNLVSFTWNLSPHKLSEYWHPWSQSSFAVITSFLLTLLVQAPSTEDAAYANSLSAKWRRTMRSHARVTTLLSSTTTQTSTLAAHPSDFFYLPPHVSEALRRDRET